MDRKVVIFIILLIFAVIALFLPAMAKWQGMFCDDQATSEFVKNSFFAGNLQKGIIPLWDPHIWGGALVHCAFIYSGLNYYLPLWPFFFLADLDNLNHSYWMLTILPLLMHYILAAIGMFVLLKKVVKCNSFSAFIGAFAYVYTPVFTYGYVAQNIIIMSAWLPWLIFLSTKIFERFRLWKLLLASIIFAFMWTAGAPHFLFFLMIIWGSFVLLSIINNLCLGKKKDAARAFFFAGMIFIIGIALSAIYLYPIFDGIEHTNLHMELTPDAALSNKSGSLSLPYLATLFLPNLFGNITGDNLIFRPLVFWEANMAGGMATTLAVILGILLPFTVLSKKIWSDNKRKYAIMGVFLYLFAILCALGDTTPFYRLAVGWIPLIGGFPSPVRYRMIQCFASSLLIAIGLNYLIVSRPAIPKYKLRKLVRYFIIFSFFVICAVLFLPQNNIKRESWLGRPDFKEAEFFYSKEPAGVYTLATNRIKKIGVMFNGDSVGEIRYSDNNKALPDEGILAGSYSVLKKGWAEFDVDVPPGKFLWIYPKSGSGEIGHWEEKRPSCIYRDKWISNIGVNSIGVFQGKNNERTSLFYKVARGYIVKDSLVFSIWYWLLISLLLIITVYFLPLKKFGWFLTVIILIEFFVFGMMAFYKCKFTDSISLPQNHRYLRPSDHPDLQNIVTRVPAAATDPTLRIVTSCPAKANFVYLNKRFSLIGWPAYPLDNRFRKAIETFYGRSMNLAIFNGIFPPGKAEFFNNFSVGYFINNNPKKVFFKEECKVLAEDTSSFLHINNNALPRVYTLDRVIEVLENEQLERLVGDDLRKAVYSKSIKSRNANFEEDENYIVHFDDLQKTNLISRMDFSNPNRVEVDINVKVPSMLVLTEVWYPGWEVTVDGKKENIDCVNYCQRGIWLEKGSHQVRLEFRPLAWYIGMIISLGTIGLMIGLLILNGLRRRRS